MQTLPNRFLLPRFIAGIDPDINKSGLAVFDRKEKAFQCLKCVHSDDLKEILLSYAPDSVLIVVEAGWLNPGMWHGKDTQGWDGRKAKAYGAAIATQVGKNHHVGQSFLTYFSDRHYQTDTYRPASAKWKAPFFKRQTKLTKGHNQEIRDAVRAIWTYIDL